MMPKPQRMVLSRRKGFDLQATSRALNGLPAKLVTRPGKWGNPFTIDEIASRYGPDRDAAQTRAVDLCSQWLRGTLDPTFSHGKPPDRQTIRTELGGHNLACWCKAGTPCQGDVLTELANS
jgi:hypothetical protein